MKKLSLIVFSFLGLATIAQDTWIQRDSINGAPRSVGAAFVANGDGHIVGGLDEDGFRRSMFSYTPWQNDWDDEPKIGGLNGGGLARGSASAFAIGEKGYVCLGQGETNPFFKDLWEFDPVTNIWTQKADFIGSPRRQAIAFTLYDMGYVGTGIDATGFKKDMFKYDASTNTWTQINDFGGTARKEAVAFEMGHHAYVGTGDDGVMRNDFWQYDPTFDNWVQKADFPGTPRKGAIGWGQFPQAFIGTGEDINFTYTNDLWEYNYWADAWVQRANFMGAGRSNAIAFRIGSIAYVGSGYNGIFFDDFYAYQRILSLDEISEVAEISVYPNPVQDHFQVKSKIDDLEIKVFDMQGRDITGSLTIQNQGKTINIDRNNLPVGHYIIQLYESQFGKVYDGKVIFV